MRWDRTLRLPTQMTLSVVVITKNEERNIRACLQSVAWVDEIIVLDSGSEDATTAIAREFTDKVFVTDWPGYGPQKNRALSYATQTWVLSIDADERVSAALRAELEQAMAVPQANVAFEMPRSSSYCGHFMRHGGWWPDYVTRLFKRGAARFSDDIVHERVIAEGAVGRLRQPLIHYTYLNAEEVIDKINAYSSGRAHILAQRGRRAGIWTAIGHGLWTFIRTYFLRLGFLDGRAGFMLAVSNAETSYYRYVKLMLLNDSDKTVDKHQDLSL